MPPALAEFERRVRRFKRGEPLRGEDYLITKFEIGSRVFVLAVYLTKKAPDEEAWKETGRNLVGMNMSENGGTVECATFFFVRRSKEPTFDGASFYRYGFKPKPSAA